MGDTFPSAGGVFEERYRIESLLGQGGYARIYLARQIDLDREVAIKVLNPGLKDDPTRGRDVGERFRREAKLVASLRDPHTVIMHDYGQTGDGLLYMVFEYIDGLTLSELVEEEGSLGPERVTKILRQTLSSLQEAHAMGILHRDIKPANIMVYEHIGRTDQVKVLDFGIAKDVLSEKNQASRDLTQSGMIIGTPRYMAPEQLRGEEIGPFTDIYSLGLLAYELLVGEKAIEIDSMISIITTQVSEDSFELPAELNLSPAFRALIHKMLNKSVEARFADSAEVIAALDALSADDLSTTITHTPPIPIAQEERSDDASLEDISAEILELEDDELEDASEWFYGAAIKQQKDKRLVYAGLLALLLLLVFFTFLLWPRGGEELEAGRASSVAQKSEGSAEATRADKADKKAAALEEGAELDEQQDIEAGLPGLLDEADELDDPSALDELSDLDEHDSAKIDQPEEPASEEEVEKPALAEERAPADKKPEDSPAPAAAEPAAKPSPSPPRPKPPPRPAQPKPKPKPASSGSSFPALDDL